MTKILIAFHSLYGHTYTLAENIKLGAEKIENVSVKLTRIQETLPKEIIASMGASERVKLFEHIPITALEDLEQADCIILGSPTYFGKISSQMAAFMDSTGTFYAENKLKNKVGGAFVSSGCQNGGSEEALRTIINYFFHQSMIVVGVDTSDENMIRNDKVIGTSCYGVSCVAGEKYNEKQVSEEEIKFAQDFGKRLAFFTDKLKN